MRKVPQLLGGSAGRAVATGGFWSLTRTGKSLTMRLERPAPRRGAADPNAPCGASTAAPVFGARRLVKLIPFCKLQIIDQSFGVCVFICVCSLHISADICMFLMFAVNSLRVRRCWQSVDLIAKMCPKCINKYAIIHQKSCKIHPKSTKMGPRSAPKATLGASRLEVA